MGVSVLTDQDELAIVRHADDGNPRRTFDDMVVIDDDAAVEPYLLSSDFEVATIEQDLALEDFPRFAHECSQVESDFDDDGATLVQAFTPAVIAVVTLLLQAIVAFANFFDVVVLVIDAIFDAFHAFFHFDAEIAAVVRPFADPAAPAATSSE